MVEKNILKITNRNEFRNWLMKNAHVEKECYIVLKRGKPIDNIHFWYIDAVEEALCFGWIDSTYKLINGIRMQRFSPRGKKTVWSELNKERVRRLEKLGLMTDMGRNVLPNMDEKSFVIDKDIIYAMKKEKVYTKFTKFPTLYQKIRAYNVVFYKKKDKNMYIKMLNHLIEETKNGNMYGEWNDYGRLLNY